MPGNRRKQAGSSTARRNRGWFVAGDPRINRSGRPKDLIAFRELMQEVAEQPALNALLDALKHQNVMARLKAAEMILAYSRGRAGNAGVVPVVDHAAEAAAEEAAGQALLEKLRRMEETLKKPPEGFDVPRSALPT